MRKLVVGLGNPGSKYEGTRHNIGFEVIDRLAEGGSGSSFSRKFDGLVAETEIDFRRITLLKPETFMNLSGRSVAQAMRFYKLELTDLLVVCDDLSLPLGKLRIRVEGPTADRKGYATSAPTSGARTSPGSGSESATADRSMPPTSSSAGSAPPNARLSMMP